MSKVYFKMRGGGDKRTFEMDAEAFEAMAKKSPASFIKVKGPSEKQVVSYKLDADVKAEANEAVESKSKQARKGTK